MTLKTNITKQELLDFLNRNKGHYVSINVSSQVGHSAGTELGLWDVLNRAYIPTHEEIVANPMLSLREDRKKGIMIELGDKYKNFFIPDDTIIEKYKNCLRIRSKRSSMHIQINIHGGENTNTDNVIHFEDYMKKHLLN